MRVHSRSCRSMARKWFQLVGEDGNAVTSATSVVVDVEDVDTLRDAVKVKCPNNLANIDAADLTVFDANGVPLPKSSSSVSELGKDEDNAIIVQVRKRAVAMDVSVTAKLVKEIHDQVVQTKRKRYVHSEMSSNKGNALLQDLNIRVKPVGTVPFTARDSAPVQGFKWESVCDGRGQNIALTEEQQRERYREYVEYNIGDVLTEKKLCVLGVEKDKNILSVAVPGHDIDLVGRTDILMLIEVKKVVKAGSGFQALSELIALDFLVDDPVMALLTNLTDHWQFFWVSEKNNSYVIIQTTTVTEPGAAFAVIRTLLAQAPIGDADITLPCFEEPMKRRKLVKILPTISEGGDSSGIRAAIERYYDIASVLGPDIDMARAAANQIARTIPVFSYKPEV
ncbi:hypothetical protein Plhal710r2_c006g0027881 [Plasmopara halstedii]